MKVFVTGVAGLIGANLAHWVNENKTCGIVGLDNLSGGFPENVPSGISFHVLDLTRDFSQIEDLFRAHQVDVIYHFAAYAAENLSPFIRCFNYTNNLIATSFLVNCAIKYGVRRFVFTSSIAVYGHGMSPFTESARPAPNDPYGIAKAACEQDIRVASEQHGIEYCIFRPHNVYGPRQCIWDKYRNVLGIWCLQHKRGLPITIMGDGSQTRCFTFIEDLLEVLWAGGISDELKNETFNLGASAHHSISEAADIFFDTVKSAKKIEYLDRRHEVEHAVCSHEKIHSVARWRETPLDEGFERMWS